MSAQGGSLPNRLAITEQPILVQGWDPEAARDRPGAIVRELRDLMRRLAEAEFARSSGEEQRRKEQAGQLLKLLEVVDAFERVFQSIQSKPDQVTPQMKKWIGNFRTVSRMLREILSEQGVVRIENLADGFDPAWHRAVETQDDPDRPEGTILEEIRPGYIWPGGVLRKAEVVVVRHDEGDTTE